MSRKKRARQRSQERQLCIESLEIRRLLTGDNILAAGPGALCGTAAVEVGRLQQQVSQLRANSIPFPCGSAAWESDGLRQNEASGEGPVAGSDGASPVFPCGSTAWESGDTELPIENRDRVAPRNDNDDAFDPPGECAPPCGTTAWELGKAEKANAGDQNASQADEAGASAIESPHFVFPCGTAAFEFARHQQDADRDEDGGQADSQNVWTTEQDRIDAAWDSFTEEEQKDLLAQQISEFIDQLANEDDRRRPQDANRDPHWLVGDGVDDEDEKDNSIFLGGAEESNRPGVDVESGRPGRWSTRGDTRQFRSLDGRLVLIQSTDPKLGRIETKVTKNSDGTRHVVVTPLSESAGWTKITGTLGKDGSFQPDRTHLADGRSYKVHAGGVIEMFDAKGNRIGLQVDGAQLFNASGDERVNLSWTIAKTISKLMGWDDENFQSSQPVAQMLIDTIGSKDTSDLKSMSIVVENSGKIQVIHTTQENGRGDKRVVIAQFGDLTPYWSNDDTFGLVARQPFWIFGDGNKNMGRSTYRQYEYRPNGSRLYWSWNPGGKTEGGVFTADKYHTNVTINLQSRDPSYGEYRTRYKKVHHVVSEESGSSGLGMLGQAFLETRGIGDVLQFLGAAGSQGYNFIVGGNQFLVGTLADDEVYRVDARAALLRATSGDKEDYEQELEIIKSDPEEFGYLKARVYNQRERALRNSGASPDAAFTQSDYQDLIYGPISDQEFIDTLRGEVGAGYYGRMLADLAAESDGWASFGWTVAATGMHFSEQTAQNLPTLLALTGVSYLATPEVAMGVYGVAEATTAVQVTASTARVASSVFNTWTFASGGVDTISNAIILVGAIQDGNYHRGTEVAGSVFFDFAQTAQSARNLQRTSQNDVSARNPHPSPDAMSPHSHSTRLENIVALSDRTGIHPDVLNALSRHAHNDTEVVMVRTPKLASRDMTAESGTRPKSGKVKTKTNPDAGVVTFADEAAFQQALKPSVDENGQSKAPEIDPKFAKEEGLHLRETEINGETYNVLFTKDGDFFISDLDLLDVFAGSDGRQVNTGSGKSARDGQAYRQRLDNDINPRHNEGEAYGMIQHGAGLQYIEGPVFSPTETIAVFTPDFVYVFTAEAQWRGFLDASSDGYRASRIDVDALGGVRYDIRPSAGGVSSQD